METSEILFATLGMVILDDIYFGEDWNNPILDSLGGSGTYSTLGARLFCSGNKARCIGWIVRIGAFFPAATLDKLISWGTTMHLINETVGTTRGHLRYHDTTMGSKDFRYSSMPLYVLPEHFTATPALRSRSFHFLARHGEIFRDVPKLLRIREAAGISERPKIIWEPYPATCIPKHLGAYLKAMKLVDVFSPNHTEMGKFYGIDTDQRFDRRVYEDIAGKVLGKGIGEDGNGCLVIRAGEHGCMVCTREMEHPRWLPAYYEAGNEKLMDTTGAGNSFLGGFAIGLAETRDLVEAAIYGTIAASFVVEQMGVPDITSDNLGEELWNGEGVRNRLGAYRARIHTASTRPSDQHVTNSDNTQS